MVLFYNIGQELIGECFVKHMRDNTLPDSVQEGGLQVCIKLGLLENGLYRIQPVLFEAMEVAACLEVWWGPCLDSVPDRVADGFVILGSLDK